MLHIILGILKIIGILLGIIFLFLLAALLALIFVPLRYRLSAKARMQPAQYEVSVQVSWLLHIVHAAVTADSSGEREIAVRLFGIRLPLFRRENGKGTDGKEKKSRKKREDNAGREQAGESRNANTEINTEPRGSKAEADSAKPHDSEPETEAPRPNIFEKIRFQCRRFCDKIRQITEFLAEYEAREVFGSLAGYLVFLLAHYKPRRIQGYLRFGTGDPAAMGQLTGLIYILLPARAERYSVEPEFTERVFDTETICSGHIRALHVLRVLWRGFRNKKLRRMISAFRESKR